MIYLFITLPHTFFEKISENKIKIIVKYNQKKKIDEVYTKAYH